MRIEITPHGTRRPRPPTPAWSRDGAAARATVEVTPHGEQPPSASAR